MSVISPGGASRTGEARATRAPAGDATPVRADGVELIGEMRGSGYRRPPALARRRDGQVVQLTPLLYRTLCEIDGRRDYADIASAVGVQTGRDITAADIRQLVDSRLRPLGLVRLPDGSEAPVRRANPLLALRFRMVVADPRTTRRITAPFAWLFQPLLAATVIVAFVAICKWVLFTRGLGFAAHQAFVRPGLLLAIFVITVLSAGFHEFGHAAGARYGGAVPGAMGAGIYLAWPAFYTDVTDAYRLGRGGRLRTDLGGLYFNALLSVVVFGVWWLTGWDALLLVIATQLIQMVRQLPPLLRFDGYHILADTIGVPDLFRQIKPTLLGLLPTRWNRPESKALKPWARAVVTLWVLVVVPLMISMVLLTVIALPRMLATAAAGLDRQWRAMAGEFGAGSVGAGLTKVLAILAILLPVLGVGYLLIRSARRIVTSTLRATAGKPGQRALAAVVGVALLAGLVFAWWPHGNYRQIQPWERGAVQDALPAAFGVHHPQTETAATVWPADAGPLPTRDHPQLALVLIPRSGNGPAWVFPFNRPAPPGPGDNQSLAVNTRNGTSVYDVAFALVWATGDTVLNKNEAYAFASCSHCRAEAVSFQIILIIGHANVAAPQNISAAVNYNCIVCVTNALAVQLVLTLPSAPSAAEIRDINALWRQIQAFARQIPHLPFAVVHARLLAYERQLIAIITRDSGGVAPTVVSPTSTSTPSGPAVSGSLDSSGSNTGQPAVAGTTSGGAATSTSPPSTSGSASSPPSSSPTPSPSG